MGFKKGKANFMWRGDDVKISGIHSWVRDRWGQPKKCEHCGTTDAKMFDWSNKDHKYSRRRIDWQRLCRSCHIKYDTKKFGRKPPPRPAKIIFVRCIVCNRSGLKHKARGMCSTCYGKSYE